MSVLLPAVTSLLALLFAAALLDQWLERRRTFQLVWGIGMVFFGVASGSEALAAAGVVCDYRVPDRLRLGPSPIYTRFVDLWDAVDRLRRLVAAGEHEHLPRELPRVT